MKTLGRYQQRRIVCFWHLFHFVKAKIKLSLIIVTSFRGCNLLENNLDNDYRWSVFNASVIGITESKLDHAIFSGKIMIELYDFICKGTIKNVGEVVCYININFDL